MLPNIFMLIKNTLNSLKGGKKLFDELLKNFCLSTQQKGTFLHCFQHRPDPDTAFKVQLSCETHLL